MTFSKILPILTHKVLNLLGLLNIGTVLPKSCVCFTLYVNDEVNRTLYINDTTAYTLNICDEVAWSTNHGC